jgi:arylamine N-acetyltransferase
VVSFPGNSLARYWSKKEDTTGSSTDPVRSEVTSLLRVPDQYPIAKGDMTTLVLKQYHYIKNGDGREELYDFETDPSETRDLADSEEHRQMLDQFRMHLKTALAHEQLRNNRVR